MTYKIEKPLFMRLSGLDQRGVEPLSKTGKNRIKSTFTGKKPRFFAPLASLDFSAFISPVIQKYDPKYDLTLVSFLKRAGCPLRAPDAR